MRRKARVVSMNSLLSTACHPSMEGANECFHAHINRMIGGLVDEADYVKLWLRELPSPLFSIDNNDRRSISSRTTISGIYSRF